MQIEGTSGARLDVMDGRALVDSLSKTPLAIASERGDAFSWTAVTADIDTGDTALLVANDNPNKKLHVTKIYCWADVAVQFKIHCPAYAAPAGTAVVGNNLNRGSGNVAMATAKADESANTFAAANTVLTLHSNELATDQKGLWADFEGALILDYHQSVAVDIIGESGAFECTIFGYFE